MLVTVKTLPKSQVKLTVEVTEATMHKYYEQAAKEISGMVKIPGFRPGHVPLDVLKAHVKDDAIESHALDLALPEIYTQALKKEKVQAVSRPKIEIVSQKPLKFEATVAVFPEVKISGYDNITIKRNELKVEDREVEEVLADIKRRRATFKDADRAAKMGDRVEVDFEGFDSGGAPLENTKSANHPLVLGEKSLVAGFEEELVGLKKDDKKSFQITFPKDYFHKQFQNKKVEFRVEVRRVEEMQMPELNAEFIKSISGKEQSIEELKKNIEENLVHDKEQQEKVRRENEFLEKIVSLAKVDIPEQLVEEELDGMIDELKNELESTGLQFDQYLAQTKKEIKDLRSDRRKEAEKRLTLRFGLNKLFEQEQIKVTPEEMKKEIAHVVGLYPPKEQYKIRKEYEDGGYLHRRLENKLRMEKLFERFLGK